MEAKDFEIKRNKLVLDMRYGENANAKYFKEILEQVLIKKNKIL